MSALNIITTLLLAQEALALTWISVSDTHIGTANATVATTAMCNDTKYNLVGTAWPNGGVVDAPVAIIHSGDMTSNSRSTELNSWLSIFGGVCTYPVYETNGNHDGNTGSNVRQAIISRTASGRSGLVAISSTGLYYSWEWNVSSTCSAHFVAAGLKPADDAGNEGSLTFLAGDLAQYVGSSGKPVFVMHHYGFESYSRQQWSNTTETAAEYALLRAYNTVAVFHGHTHEAKTYVWNGSTTSLDTSAAMPSNITVVNTGSTTSPRNNDAKGYLVNELTETATAGIARFRVGLKPTGASAISRVLLDITVPLCPSA